MIPNTELSDIAPPMMQLSDIAPRPIGPGQALTAAFSDIKPAHTVFALPFALLGGFLAAFGHGANTLIGDKTGDAGSAAGSVGGGAGGISAGSFAGMIGLVVLCMVFARTWAMLVNRLADRRFDAANPRTSGRALAAGRLGTRHAAAVALGCAILFMVCCVGFLIFFGNPWPVLLGGPTLAWIAFYSFTKRFTWASHLFLGGALAASPIAAAIAVRPGALADTPALWWIAAMVLVWVAGFDALYALQDLDFDRRAGLRSIPARFGWRGAVRASRLLHAGAIACLLVAWRAEPTLGGLFITGVALAAALLAVEHVIVARRGLAGLPVAFFTVNGVVSLTLGALGCIDTIR